MANEIVTEIRLELDKFRANLKDAQNAGETAGKKTGEGFGSGVEGGLEKAFGGVKGKLLALAGAIAGAFTLKESIKAAEEQESAINALNSALAVSGNYTAQASQHFQEFAASLQQTTIYADEVITQGGAMLATLGKLSGQGLERATQASLDLAAALHIDVNTAFNLVSKAATGNVGVLSRYGIQLKSTGDQAQDFNKALSTLEQRFGGLAQLQTNTFAGAFAQTKNQFGEILESIGNLIIKSPTLIALLKLAANAFASVAESISNFGKNRDIIGEIAKTLILFGTYVNTYLIVPLEFGFNLLKTGALAIATVLEGLISIVAKVGAGINDFLVKPIIDLIGGGLGALVSLVDKDLGAALSNFVATSTQSVSDGLNVVGANAASLTEQLAIQTAGAANGVFDFDVAAASENFLLKASEFVSTVAPPLQANFQQISDNIKKPLEGVTFDQVVIAMQGAGAKLKVTAEDIAKTINTAFVQAPTQAFSQFGAALVKGDNAFAAFGKSILSSLGQILIQFGSMLIAIGVGLSTVPFLFGLQGPAAVAAGVAAVILGGALTALGGGGGAGASAPSGGGGGGEGGGVAAGGGGGVAPQAQAVAQNDTLRGEVGTKVEVNVQGNVFDRKETGLMIADTINEAFGSSGITFATGNA